MHTLVVTVHPEPESLTHHTVRQLAAALRPGSVEIADLTKEGFDPRFTLADHQAYQQRGGCPPDVRREQQRIDRASDLVLVFPVYWWSMPALLKGWIDRVFINGWAFDYTPATGIQPRLQRLTTHLLPIAGDDAGSYEKHGYGQALRTQIEHGIVDYCGSRRGVTAFVHESERDDSAATAGEVDRAVALIREAIAVPLHAR
ncbi:NAD(P)H-dependent oxidoreductase [Micromonospora sp. NPDC048935]|uniref:NAD(P)H-dependent oxidoreductase n=1 Tax=Micromonospora sp. NPDC048935 TaxID=3364262 RepID=UPI003717808C